MAIVDPQQGTPLCRCASVANRPFFKKVKITKRTQFKNPPPAIPASREVQPE